MILFLLATLPIYFYLGLRLSSHWSHWVLLGVLYLAIMSFPFRKLFRLQLHLSYTAMGLISFLLMFTVLRDATFLITQKIYSPALVLEFTFISLFLGFVNATRGPTIRSHYVEEVVRKTNLLEADLIVLTGDIGDGPVKKHRNDISPLGFLKSRHGSFFVTGNHEYYWNANEWLSAMNNLGIINLINRGKVIDHYKKRILIAGVPDPVSRLLPDLTGMQETSTDFKILLSHRPGIAEQASLCGYQLQLSGHTHGGQFFPWTIVVKFVHKMSKGLHRINGMWLYVSPGTGSWRPLIRLGTTPEITLLTLTQSRNEKKLIT